MRYHLLMDADDTLWENNIYYEQAIQTFITLLDHPRLSPEEIRVMLDDVERNKGYGSAAFTLSLMELHRSLVEESLHAVDLEQIRRLGASVREYPIQLMDGVRETLDYLHSRHDLVLMTKGNHDEQKGKIERSGIKEYFQQTVIVQEKDVATYHRIVNELRFDPRCTWMIGNSPRSDINPALAAGLKAVFIPHPQTWRLEHEQIEEPGDGRLLTLAAFSDLRRHF